MDFLKKSLLYSSLLILASSCQMGYIFKSAYNHIALLNAKIPIEIALKDPNLTTEEKKKLKLALDIRQFAKKELGLKIDKNYSTFVNLKRPYVSYVVSAAPKWNLETYRWSFPIVGKVPYKGYFNEQDAMEEEIELKKEDLDTYVRGVTAYSTLGWFSDPLLSSMLRGNEAYLVNTIIHESVHATLFIKNEADFNERLATFLGNKGMELYYQKLEGQNSPTLRKISLETKDDHIFSKFISEELDQLQKWYESTAIEKRTEESRLLRIADIQKKFRIDILPQLKSGSMDGFAKIKLNNARLLVYKTYMHDLNDFEKLYVQLGNNFTEFLNKIRTLENHKNPQEGLKSLIN